MAEQKKPEQIPFDSPEQTNQTPDSFKVFVSPLDRLKRTSRFEKIAAFGLIAMLIFLSIVMVNLRNDITKLQNDISNTQTEVDSKNQTASQLQQEKNELSRAARLKKVAEEAGLTINDDNLRKVK